MHAKDFLHNLHKMHPGCMEDACLCVDDNHVIFLWKLTRIKGSFFSKLFSLVLKISHHVLPQDVVFITVPLKTMIVAFLFYWSFNLFVCFHSILSYIIGIVWLCALSDRAFNGRVYFSENALLPGLVEAEFKNHRLASELFGKLSTLPEGDMRYCFKVAILKMYTDLSAICMGKVNTRI